MGDTVVCSLTSSPHPHVQMTAADVHVNCSIASLEPCLLPSMLQRCPPSLGGSWSAPFLPSALLALELGVGLKLRLLVFAQVLTLPWFLCHIRAKVRR